ncbi:MAG TPA: hypothetical protein PLE16_00070 [Spirochaetota bacterium]|jgi:hypothetical protein|nr:hypothetical protein [Spirochaetota bacterium]HOH37867.1 hypothetical protein [Spirochaetota bacterium]HPJ13452.1 hypothetical protein [Spirochaetota bacterium]HPM32971.1 hypothetical protein [Spirochaetota bacterium]
MFKKMILIILSIMVFSKIHSQNKEYFFPETEAGQYVYYLDTRKDNMRLTGLLKFYDDTIVCRSIDLKTKESCLITLKITENKDRLEISPDRLLEGNFEKNIQFMLVDVLNIAEQYRRNKDNINYQKSSFNDEWKEFGYTLVHTFSKTVPFFNLLSTSMKGGKENIYQAVLIGRMRDSKDKTFFEFDSLKIKNNESAKFTISLKSKKELELNETGLILDDNWNLVKGGSYPDTFKDAYWISLKSARDAQICVYDYDLKKLNPKISSFSTVELANMFVSVHPRVIPSSINIIENNKDDVEAEFIVVDTVTNYKTFMHTRTVRKGNRIKFIDFSTYQETYEANKNYFDKIFKSIKLKK